jgi:hypothetical protein
MPPVDALRDFLTRRFHLVVFTIVALYCALQFLYIAHLPLVMDEFDGAYEAYHLRHAVPYRDFTPYKTVLGYGVELLGTFAAHSVWPRILAIKAEIVLINCGMLFAAALMLSRMVSRSAVAAALALLIVCSTFLERSSELRVDMLTAWAGLWSLLALLRRRPVLAGALAGLSFLVSQKGAFYIVAGAAALGVEWLLERKNIARLKAVVAYSAASIGAIAAYVAVWGAVTSFGVVLHATFVGGAQAAMVGDYEIRSVYWQQVIGRDPMYFAIVAVALVVTAIRGNLLACLYTGVILIQAAMYSQPWPYFFVVIFPTLFVAQAFFFDRVEWRTPVAIAVIALALVYPLRRVGVVMNRHNDYQSYTVDLAAALLGPHDTYLAGTDLIHDHEQWPRELARLGMPVLIDFGKRPPDFAQGILERIDQRPPKLLIGNYRLEGLPKPVRRYLHAHYARLSGSVCLYAPEVAAGNARIAFGGLYRTSGAVAIDGIPHAAGEQFELAPGTHRIDSEAPVRLRLLPRLDLLDPRYTAEQNLYPNPYSY